MMNEKLEKYEEVCPECDGDGRRIDMIVDYWINVRVNSPSCKVCNGTGKVNWIDLIKRGKYDERKT